MSFPITPTQRFYLCLDTLGTKQIGNFISGDNTGTSAFCQNCIPANGEEFPSTLKNLYIKYDGNATGFLTGKLVVNKLDEAGDLIDSQEILFSDFVAATNNAVKIFDAAHNNGVYGYAVNVTADFTGGVPTPNLAVTYKSYVALISQSGINIPSAIILNNTLGALSFTRGGTGLYEIHSPSLFTTNKTTIFIQNLNLAPINSPIQARYSAVWIDDSTIELDSFMINALFTGADDLLVNAAIEIRVYP